MKFKHISRYLFLSLIITFLTESACLAAEDEMTPLAEQMEQMGSAWRLVKRGARDASKNADTLANVKKMQAATEKAMSYTPAKLKEIPESERTQFMDDYHKGIKNFRDSLNSLAALLAADNNEAASKLIRKIDAHRERSHEAFKVEE